MSSSKGKKSNEGWFLRILDRELDYEGSCQLVLFKVEMVVVCESITLVGKLDFLLHSVLGKGQV